MTQFNVLWCSLPFIVWPPIWSWTPHGPRMDPSPLNWYLCTHMGFFVLNSKDTRQGKVTWTAHQATKSSSRSRLATILDRSNWLCRISIDWQPKKLYIVSKFFYKICYYLNVKSGKFHRIIFSGQQNWDTAETMLSLLIKCFKNSIINFAALIF